MLNVQLCHQALDDLHRNLTRNSISGRVSNVRIAIRRNPNDKSTVAIATASVTTTYDGTATELARPTKD